MAETTQKRKFHIGLGTILLIAILFYFIILIISYLNRSHIYSYQVKEGSLAISNTYTGIAIRDEIIHQSANSGYITYFAREGEHVGVNDLVYCVDESGVMNQMLNGESGGENTLTNKDLSDLKTEIINFSNSFDEKSFDHTYDFLYSIDGTILKLANNNLLNSISNLNNNSYSDVVQLSVATEPGYVVYNIDGYESLTVDDINEDIFDTTNYNKEQLLNNELIDRGSSTYKIITSEEWKIVIQLDEDRAMALKDDGYVNVRFLENQRVVSAQIEVISKENKFYGILTLNNSLVSFCSDRFVDIELMSTEEIGLKIPVTSIVHKQFYLVPEDYVIAELEDNKCLFYRKCFREDGTVSNEQLEIEVYKLIDGYYYVDNTWLRPGDYLLKEDSQEEYPISAKGELVGVFNINKGYADFRQIDILYQNEEYAIVKPNSTYGLSVYDYIVIDASSIEENDFVYE